MYLTQIDIENACNNYGICLLLHYVCLFDSTLEFYEGMKEVKCGFNSAHDVTN